MSAERVVANFLRVAKEDLDGARLLAKSGNRNAIYLCEQAAEKLIRAILTSESIHGGIGHQLDAMVDQLPDQNPLKAALREIEHLGAYATAFRYPTASGRIKPAPTADEFKEVADKVAALLTEVATRFGVDLSATNTPAISVDPIR